MKKIFSLIIAAALVSCEESLQPGNGTTCTVLLSFEAPESKSADPPDESKISDVNLFVFNSQSGSLEEHLYIDTRNFTGEPLEIALLNGVRYDIAACFNFGYRLPRCGGRKDLASMRYYMVYPDEYRIGMPMSALEEGFLAGENASLILKAVRLMAKISIRMDRRDLDEGVVMNVAEVVVGGCPKSVTPFSDSKPLDRTDVFAQGFTKNGLAVDNLNKAGPENGRSQEVDLYMLESLNGDLPSEMSDPTKAYAPYPYIEMRIDYYSPPTEGTGLWLMYRFCIGEEEGNADIKRNTRYRYTVCPHGTGLDLNPSWRVEFTK